MRISLNWLHEFVNFDLAPEVIAERLTMVGLEVESIESLGSKYDGFVVGRVMQLDQHPNADKLSVCKVEVGRGTLQIVCGAPNVAPGQKVPVGLVGATIPRALHQATPSSALLSKVSIRGVESNGMICSSYELETGDDKDGILVLDAEAKIGMPLAEYFGLMDTILEIGITPNRPDCMSHVGIAREVAAFMNRKLKLPRVELSEAIPWTRRNVMVRIDSPGLCPRYTARLVTDVKVAASPKWLQDRLSALGVRPINNVVDVTNLVLLELGHPIHAFDYDLLSGHRIEVRFPRIGEEITTLDGKQRTLGKHDLVICDSEKPVAIAGVMGGDQTEVTDRTTSVLIESAYFDPRSIRRTSKAHGLNTEASQRFERGADPNVTALAADRATQMLQQIAGGVPMRGRVDVHERKARPKTLTLRPYRVNEVLGTNLSAKRICGLLSKIDIRPLNLPSEVRSALMMRVPTFRPDISREIDLVEEVARLHGYDKIETRTDGRIKFSETEARSPFIDALRPWLVGRGFHEIVANSLYERGTSILSGDCVVEVMNPISRELAALRASLVPGALQIVEHNLNRGTKDLRFFELGRVFRKKTDKNEKLTLADFGEQERLLLLLSGQAEPLSWSSPSRSVDIFDVKGEVEVLASKIFLDKIKFICYPATNTLTDDSIGVEINDTYAGYIGKVKEEIRKRFSIDQDVFVAELSIVLLDVGADRRRKFVPLPKFPAVERDLAFIIDARHSANELIETIREASGDLLESVRIFDVFRGGNIPEGKKSCAFSLTFRSKERTLTEAEIASLIERIVGRMTESFRAQLRST